MKAEVSINYTGNCVRAPSSKSAVQRYVAGALLTEDITKLSVASMCDDSLAALSVAESLGAEVKTYPDSITVRGGFRPVNKEINCGESGLATRMFIPIAALHDGEITITGRGSVMNRPVVMVEEPLLQLGVEVLSRNGYLPVKIKGPLKGGSVIADGSVSSQFITGLLMALPVVENDSRIFVKKLVSKPYIDLTIKILEDFGVEVINESYQIFYIKGKQKYKHGNFVAEGDWSGAAFLLVMGAIGGSVEVTGLNTSSVQADKSVLEALRRAGASVKEDKDKISVTGGNLKGFEFDITDCPDLAPPLAVLGLACKGRSVLQGTERLVAKESNRAQTICHALNTIGANIKSHDNIIETEGVETLKGGEASSFNDHRIAMALMSASLISESPVIINGIECINKSYPGFIEDFRKLGGNVRIFK